MSKSAHLKCTWTNCLIWSGISLALGLVLRILLWYFVVYLGDSSVYFDEFCYGIIWMLSLPAVFSVLCYIPTYKGYMNRAAVHPDDLYGVAHGQYGKPWILTLILLIVLDVIWLIVSALNVYFGFALDLAIEWKKVANPVMTTSASSTYSGDRATHDAINLLDGDTKTNWTEGVQGDGIGEYVEFTFVDNYLLNAIFIYPGNQYDEDRYLDNSRPEKVSVTFSDGTTIGFTLKDMMDGQAMVMPEPVMTDSVRITIHSVFHGAKYTDTVISDVSFDAYAPNVK